MSAVIKNLTGIQIEGNLIAPDLTTEFITGSVKGQAPEDFGKAKTDKLADEIAIAWGDAKAYWAAFQRRLLRLDENDLATSITREQWAVPLLESLGYQLVYTAKAEIVDGQTYAISHRVESGENKPPVHIIGCRVKLEQRPPSGTPRLSAHALMQEYLNRTEHLWGIVTNGLQWRLLRDSSLMTRLTYIEFDLEQILNNENFAEFGLFYRLFHRSRLPQGMDDADQCLLEHYHTEAIAQGGRVRDRLRDGVEKALIQLGTGFLQHPDNEDLRQRFESGELTHKVYYRQLLLLIYRLLFLMVAESRNLLLTDDEPEKARIYLEYYSIERLRNLTERPSWRREGFQDLWQGLRVTFCLFDENWRGEVLGLSPLNGSLFGSSTLLDLNSCAIDNHDLSLAIRYLSLYEQKGQQRRVNYGALDVEELGSVYESLLDFNPLVSQRNGIYEFQLVAGSDRKTTGSFYTPPELVGLLIKSALEPVIEAKLQSALVPQKPPTEAKSAQETALLSLKVVDPACGSGHFLLAAARRIGKELARIRTGEAQPGIEPLKQAIRDVIQHCIYGVDLNPLAVDLCKVALWIEGFCRGLPLNFLDHRIKCGNSLVGVLDISCLDEGIPDEAFKPVTGDDRKLSAQFKKRNKQERQDIEAGQLSLNLYGGLGNERSQYAAEWQELGSIPETNTNDVKRKQSRYMRDRSPENSGWWRDYSACNLWTAAFFMPLTEQNLQLLPTTAALSQLLQGNATTRKVVEAANKLAEEKNFFHWCLEFPEVFEAGGFDTVLGNPPWERIKLQEKEFFASRSFEIANAANKAAREKLIKQLQQNNPELAQAWEDAKHDADAQGKFIRESARFPLTAVGDINTYAVFSEIVINLISPYGRSGIIIPIGIATDDTTKIFFSELIKNQRLASLTGFENEAFIFPAVDHTVKFCTLTVTGISIKSQQAEYTFFCRYFTDVHNHKRHFNLTSKDIALINPNTFNCPVFRTQPDVKITKNIYRTIPVLDNESTGINPWQISLSAMLHMANDSRLFVDVYNTGFVPVYEAKMFHQFDHRYSTYEGATQANLNAGILPRLNKEFKQNFSCFTQPRYWISPNEVKKRLFDWWNKQWLIVARKIGKTTNERTAIFSIIPKYGCGDSIIILIPSVKNTKLISCLVANSNSLVFDFVTRQKQGGNNLAFFILKQLPVIPPEAYTQEDIEFISSRVLELVYTAYDMQPFAQDMGYDGEPFIWNPERRALLRAELDAYYAKLYGLTRDELRYILDPADVYGADFPSETFRVLKNHEIKQFGEYRTQRLVLAAWDMLGY
ncbi:putative type II DNA modification enzyme [Crinalium epipsammum PCC 9333]|uniref:site-specific DNA-methyltransferase (adenine-specific) n=1 Tax=Crinalium epipsammum PCC 9333 TaxID=1173022 RepID=K9VU28_9CYAN|nr:N-6 DNA methylase [Crinalium epipsammum]AFZ11466.1 putative type II DNA modification enzyme [Crinalium epipsammum PCC 9333]